MTTGIPINIYLPYTNFTNISSIIPLSIYANSAIFGFGGSNQVLDTTILNLSWSNGSFCNINQIVNKTSDNSFISYTSNIYGNSNIITNLLPNTSYTVSIIPNNSSGLSNLYSIQTTSAYTLPIINSFSFCNITTTSITAYWSGNSYTNSIYYFNSNSTFINNINASSYTLNNLLPNSSYIMNIIPYNNSLIPGNSITSSIIYTLSYISSIYISNITNNSLYLSWNTSNSAFSNLQISVYNINNSLVNTIKNVISFPPYIVTGLNENTPYYITAIPYNLQNNSNILSISQSPIAYTYATVGPITQVTYTESTIFIDWQGIGTYTTLNIQLSSNTNILNTYYNQISSNFTFSNLLANNIYTLNLIPINSINASNIINIQSSTVNTLATISGVNSSSITSNSFILSWNPSYTYSSISLVVNKQSDNSISQKNNNIYTTTQLVSNLLPNTSYITTITPINSQLVKNNNANITLNTTTLATLGTASIISYTDSTTTIGWSSGSYSYISITYNGITISGITSQPYTVNNLYANSNYSFNLKVFNSINLENPVFRQTLSSFTLANIGSLFFTNVDTTFFTINWNTLQYGGSNSVKILVNNTTTTALIYSTNSNIKGTKFLIPQNTLAPNTNYTVSVIPYNTLFTSNINAIQSSSIITLSTLGSIATPTVSSFTDTTAVVNWTQSPAYFTSILITWISTTGAQSGSNQSLSYANYDTASNLIADQSYIFTINAVNSLGLVNPNASLDAGTIITTYPNITYINTCNVTANTMSLQWKGGFTTTTVNGPNYTNLSYSGSAYRFTNLNPNTSYTTTLNPKNRLALYYPNSSQLKTYTDYTLGSIGSSNFITTSNIITLYWSNSSGIGSYSNVDIYLNNSLYLSRLSSSPAIISGLSDNTFYTINTYIYNQTNNSNISIPSSLCTLANVGSPYISYISSSNVIIGFSSNTYSNLNISLSSNNNIIQNIFTTNNIISFSNLYVSTPYSLNLIPYNTVGTSNIYGIKSYSFTTLNQLSASITTINSSNIDIYITNGTYTTLNFSISNLIFNTIISYTVDPQNNTNYQIPSSSMSSNTQLLSDGFYTISYSSDWNTTTPVYNIFDSSTSTVITTNSGIVASGVYKGTTTTIDANTSTIYSGGYITIQTPVSILPKSYSISVSAVNRYPTAWVILASNDGILWYTCDVKTNQTLVLSNIPNIYTISSITQYYSYFRIVITASSSSGNFAQMNDFKIFGNIFYNSLNTINNNKTRITALNPNTNYSINVTPVDSSSNLNPAAATTLSYTTLCSFTNISTSNILSTSITLYWGSGWYFNYMKLSYSSSNIVYLSPTSSQYTFSNLTPNTLYNFNLSIYDLNNNEAIQYRQALSNIYTLGSIGNLSYSTLTSNSFKISWNSGIYTQYNGILSLTNTNTIVSSLFGYSNSSNILFNNLAPNTSYNISVIPYNIIGNSNIIESKSLSNINTLANVLTINTTNLLANSVTVNWIGGNYSNVYLYWNSTSGAPNGSNTTPISDSSYTIYGLTQYSKYIFSIIPINNAGVYNYSNILNTSEILTPHSFTIPFPSTPILKYTADSLILASNTPVYTWSNLTTSFPPIYINDPITNFSYLNFTTGKYFPNQTIPNVAAAFNTNDGFTSTLLINFTSIPISGLAENIFIWNGTTSAIKHEWIHYGFSPGNIAPRINQITSPSYTPTYNTWELYILTVQPSTNTWNLYKNNSIVATGNNNSLANYTAYNLLQINGLAGDNFKLHGFAIYDRLLTFTEMTNIFTSIYFTLGYSINLPNIPITNITAYSFTINWNFTTSYNTINLIVYLSTNLITPIVSYNGLTTTSQSITGLIYNTLYSIYLYPVFNGVVDNNNLVILRQITDFGYDASVSGIYTNNYLSTGNGFTVGWNSSSTWNTINITGTAGSYSNIITSSYSISNLIPNTYYSVNIIPLNNIGIQNTNATSNLSILTYATVSGVNANTYLSSGTGFSIGWNSSSSWSNININGTAGTFSNIKSSSYSISNLIPNTLYTINVYPVNNSNIQNTLGLTTLNIVTYPTLTSLTVLNINISSVSISCTGLYTYLDIYVTGGIYSNFWLYQKISGTTVIVTGLQGNTFYTFTVIPSNSQNITNNYYSQVVSTTTLTPVTSLYSFTYGIFNSANTTNPNTISGPALATFQSPPSSSAYSFNSDLNTFGYYTTLSTQSFYPSYWSLYNSKPGYQLWTVPKTGAYTVVAAGAPGGTFLNNGITGRAGGLGAVLAGSFNFTMGQQLIIQVGQTGRHWDGANPTMLTQPGRGGGGYTSLVDASNTSVPLLVAAGGGGAGSTLGSDAEGYGKRAVYLIRNINSISVAGTDNQAGTYSAGAGWGQSNANTIPAQTWASNCIGGTNGITDDYGGFGGGGAGGLNSGVSVKGGGGGGWIGGDGAVTYGKGGTSFGGGGGYSYCPNTNVALSPLWGSYANSGNSIDQKSILGGMFYINYIEPMYSQFNITFTTCSYTSNVTGPSWSNILSTYSGAGSIIGKYLLPFPFAFKNGFQAWSVPYTGNYSITAAGAAGGTAGTYNGGRGRIVTATFSLVIGTVLIITVGNVGASGNINGGGGGGGMTTVHLNGCTFTEGSYVDYPLICAAGGSGAIPTSNGNDAGSVLTGYQTSKYGIVQTLNAGAGIYWCTGRTNSWDCQGDSGTPNDPGVLNSGVFADPLRSGGTAGGWGGGGRNNTSSALPGGGGGWVGGNGTTTAGTLSGAATSYCYNSTNTSSFNNYNQPGYVNIRQL